ncbi:hypothetical protein QUB61_04795 [Microcoleus sp. C2D2]
MTGSGWEWGVRSPIIYLPRHFHCVGCVILGIFITIKHKKWISPLTEWRIERGDRAFKKVWEAIKSID